jgi:hypothetical protein
MMTDDIEADDLDPAAPTLQAEDRARRVWKGRQQ